MGGVLHRGQGDQTWCFVWAGLGGSVRALAYPVAGCVRWQTPCCSNLLKRACKHGVYTILRGLCSTGAKHAVHDARVSPPAPMNSPAPSHACCAAPGHRSAGVHGLSVGKPDGKYTWDVGHAFVLSCVSVHMCTYMHVCVCVRVCVGVRVGFGECAVMYCGSVHVCVCVCFL